MFYTQCRMYLRVCLLFLGVTVIANGLPSFQKKSASHSDLEELLLKLLDERADLLGTDNDIDDVSNNGGKKGLDPLITKAVTTETPTEVQESFESLLHHLQNICNQGNTEVGKRPLNQMFTVICGVLSNSENDDSKTSFTTPIAGKSTKEPMSSSEEDDNDDDDDNESSSESNFSRKRQGRNGSNFLNYRAFRKREPTGGPFPTGGPTDSPFPTGGPTGSPFPTSGPTGSPFPTGGPTGSPFPTGGRTGSPFPTGGPTGSPFPTGGPTGSPFPTGGPTGSPFPTAGPTGGPTGGPFPTNEPAPTGKPNKEIVRLLRILRRVCDGLEDNGDMAQSEEMRIMIALCMTFEQEDTEDANNGERSLENGGGSSYFPIPSIPPMDPEVRKTLFALKMACKAINGGRKGSDEEEPDDRQLTAGQIIEEICASLADESGED